jgi:hypothetical protein
VLTQVLFKTVPTGNYDIFAEVNLSAQNSSFGGATQAGDAFCNLMSDNVVIGSATSRINLLPGDLGKRHFTIFGGAAVATVSGNISLWCASQFGGNEHADSAAIMAVTLAGFGP